MSTIFADWSIAAVIRARIAGSTVPAQQVRDDYRLANPNPVPGVEYRTRSDLKRRGWTATMTEHHLDPPDYSTSKT